MLTTLLVNRLLVNIAYMKIWVHLTLGAPVHQSDSSHIFIAFRLDLKWLQTWLDSRKSEYFKSNLVFSLKYFFKCIGTSAFIQNVSRNRSTILSEQHVKIAEQIT